MIDKIFESFDHLKAYLAIKIPINTTASNSALKLRSSKATT
jgi:hypothetical protein